MFQKKQAVPRIGNMWINKDEETQKAKSVRAVFSVEELKKIAPDDAGNISLRGFFNNYRDNETSPHIIFRVPDENYKKGTPPVVAPVQVARKPVENTFDF